MKIVLICLLLVVAPALSWAQTCVVNKEEIMTLKSPSFTTYSLWDKVYGDKGMEQFSDFAVLPDGGFIAAGAFTKDETDQINHPLIIKYNPKGKAVWAIRDDTKMSKTADYIVPLNTGFAVLGTNKNSSLYIAVYDDNGKKLHEFPLAEKNGALTAKGIVLAPDKKGFIIAAQFTPDKTSNNGPYGILYRITSSGDLVWRRAYTPGMYTAFNSLQTLRDGAYALTGDIRGDDGRQVGWLIKLDGAGNIIWQRTYPRGAESSLYSAADFKNNNLIVTGRTQPTGGDGWAAWVMTVEPTGNVLWQKYFTGDFNLTARAGLTFEDDNRASILIDAIPQKTKQQMHTRLLTFSPEGYLMNAEDFSESMGARGLALHAGIKGERIISGYTQTRAALAENNNEFSESVYDGWMVSATPLKPYRDPCAPQMKAKP
jgi:hypothetical protein